MHRRIVPNLARLLLVTAALFAGGGLYRAQAQTTITTQKTQTAEAQKSAQQPVDRLARAAQDPMMKMRSMTNAQRKAAAAKLAARRGTPSGAAVIKSGSPKTRLATPAGMSQMAMPAATSAATTAPSFADIYFSGTIPNYANSPLPQRVCSLAQTQACYKDGDCGATGGTCSVVTGGGIHKFVDTLPGLGPNNKNDLGEYIPIAQPIKDANGNDVYAGSDYYEIGVQDYNYQFHKDLPATTQARGYADLNGDKTPHYMGPVIVAQRNRPTRIKFFNQIQPNANFFLPVDTTVMGAGTGPNGGSENYSPNRALLHLHGGDNPWISDGTPHQWITPVGETTSYPKGVSQQNVPDMPDPGDGAATYFYPNGQSARLMFYHDHSYGITRLNVYAGEAAGYLLHDNVEDGLIDAGILPGKNDGDHRWGVPLIIQDKTFVPDANTIQAQDPTWDTTKWGGYGNQWLPHVYMPNQWPDDPSLSGANPMGRWDYGPWFWPPMDPSTLKGQPIPCPTALSPNQMCPGTPNPSIVPEAFLDTPIVNGTAYPTLQVGRRAYRFRILNASNDRTLNLQLYFATDANGVVCNGTNQTGDCTEVKMVPAVPNAGLPPTWPTDGRDGGVPDPNTVGPNMIQIGTEGGFLPAPVVLPNTPVGYNYNRRDIVVLNVSNHTLLLGPAERADVIVDFSGVPDGAKLILYNDAPAPIPAFDTRYDYYTGDPDQADTGGAPTTIAGYGPNTRTVMRFDVSGGTATPFDLNALTNAFKSTSTTQGAFAAAQPTPIIPEASQGPAYNQTYPNTFSTIQATSLTFTPIDANGVPTGTPVTMPIIRKAIQELFDLDYGRMNATLGVELPLTNFVTQTTIPYFYVDPPTEVVKAGDTQIWKVTHNGVDTHSIHFHLFNVQLINRVGWDGAIRPPDPNEVGWKETVRMNPLEDAIVALRPITPQVPFTLPDSVRPLDVTMPLGATGNQFTNVDPNNNPVTTVNELTNYGWEYVWHCHLLGHEENDMMRPIVYQVPPTAPSNLAANPGTGAGAILTWTDNALTETGFTLQRSLDQTFATGVTSFDIAAATGSGSTVSYTDASGLTPNVPYYYRVQAVGANGTSAWSNVASITLVSAISVSPASLTFGTQLVNTTSNTQSITLSSIGGAQLTINSISLGGATPSNFNQTNNCPAVLNAGASCTISVSFAPSSTGNIAASLQISTNDAVNPQVQVPLSGVGSAISVSPVAVTFADQFVGTTSAAQVVTVTNAAATPVTMTGITVSGTNAGDFAQSNNCGTSLAANASCTINLTFKPTVLGARSATLTISNSDPGSPQSVALSGNGLAPVAGISPTTLTFASQLVNTTSAAQTVTLSNSGNTPLTVSSIAVGGANAADFAQTNNCTSVAAGTSCTISVTFKPATSGTKNATIAIASNDPANPSLTVTLTGSAYQPVAGAAPASLSFGYVLAGTTSSAQAVTLSNTGNGPLAISSISLSGANAADFSQTNACGTSLGAGANCAISVSFAPQTTGSKSASLVISTNDPVNPQLSVIISGTAAQKAALVSPTPGGTLTSSSVNFAWSGGSSVSAYWLYAGSTVGGTDIANSGNLPATASSYAMNVPASGATVYVRLCSMINGQWFYTDYTYTALGSASKASITSPTPGSTFTSTSVTFNWSGGSGVTAYWIYAGNSVGSTSIANSGNLPAAASSYTMSIPASGATVYVRLCSMINGAWQYTDYTYTALGSASKASITSPTPGSTFTSTSVTFNWSGGSGVTAYWIYAGNSVGSTSIANSGNLPATASSYTMSIPASGTTVYVRLCSMINGKWQYTDYTYTASGTASKASITSPTPGSTLTPTATFTWSGGNGVTAYWIYAGTSVGSTSIANSGSLPATASSYTMTVPASGATVYVRLCSMINGKWQYTDYTYTAP